MKRLFQFSRNGGRITMSHSSAEQLRRRSTTHANSVLCSHYKVAANKEAVPVQKDERTLIIPDDGGHLPPISALPGERQRNHAASLASKVINNPSSH